MGSLFKSPKAPAPMDVGAVTASANAQNRQNAYQNAAFNRIGQTDSLGNTLRYNQTGTDANGNPMFEATQSLGQTGQMYAGGLANLGQKYFDTAGNGPDLSSNAAFDRAYETATANLEPRFNRAQDRLENKLANQGFERGSEGWTNAGNDLALQQNEARNDLTSKLQGQMFTQGLQQRQQGLAELAPGVQFGNNALSLDQVNVPQVGVQNVDVAGLNSAAHNQQMQAYQQQMAQRNAMIGGLASIGGTIAGAALGGPIGAGLGSTSRSPGTWVNPDTNRAWTGFSY